MRHFTGQPRRAGGGKLCLEPTMISMHPFPHRYLTTATAGPDGDIPLEAEGIDTLATDAPAEFGGPGDRWSPETMLVGAVANCFILTFRSIARATSFPWLRIACEAEGTLDRVERVTRFTAFDLRVELELPEGAESERAMQLLERAESLCLITNSMTADVYLDARIVTAEAQPV